MQHIVSLITLIAAVSIGSVADAELYWTNLDLQTSTQMAPIRSYTNYLYDSEGNLVYDADGNPVVESTGYLVDYNFDIGSFDRHASNQPGPDVGLTGAANSVYTGPSDGGISSSVSAAVSSMDGRSGNATFNASWESSGYTPLLSWDDDLGTIETLAEGSLQLTFVVDEPQVITISYTFSGGTTAHGYATKSMYSGFGGFEEAAVFVRNGPQVVARVPVPTELNGPLTGQVTFIADPSSIWGDTYDVFLNALGVRVNYDLGGVNFDAGPFSGHSTATYSWSLGGCAPIDISPFYSQSHPLWSGEGYGQYCDVQNPPPEGTIGHKGCALTCYAMCINHYFSGNNINVHFTPSTLNDLFCHVVDGYTEGGGVFWTQATPNIAAFFGVDVRFNTSKWRSTDIADLHEMICDLRKPTIIRVPGSVNDHYVVVVGLNGTDATIVDPAGGVQKTIDLDSPPYRNEWSIRGFFESSAPSPTPFHGRNIEAHSLAALNISVSAPESGVWLLVTDPTGARIGDVGNGAGIYTELSTAAYFVDAIEDDVTGAPANDTSTQVAIESPLEGAFTVAVSSLEPRYYVLEVGGVLADGTPTGSVQLAGLSREGRASTFRVLFDHSSESNPTVTRTATIESTLADLADGEALNQISPGVAKALRNTLRQAHSAKKPKDAVKKLREFQDQVKRHLGKHLVADLANILREDVEYLLNEF